MIGSLLTRWYTNVVTALDQSVGWSRVPLLIALIMLIAMRTLLRQQNLADTSAGAPSDPAEPSSGEKRTRYLVARTADGTFNDLNHSAMGSAGTRFGRNIPLKYGFPDESTILSPNPRVVSQQLLTRETFIPATILNLLAAAWIQFMIHDWFSHGKNQKENPWQIPLSEGDPWPEHPMVILRTQPDPTYSADIKGLPPTHLNTATHWWDGSQIYGSDAATQASVRSSKYGKLNIGSDGLLPIDPNKGVDLTGVNGNWWIGLSLMHTLFTLEHNAICDRLLLDYPNWSDDELFDHARLINAALMAKIHTVEWTPAILAHPTLKVAMNANWWGLATESIYKLFGRISKSEIISGIPGSETDHFGVPYSLTEEFVSVYRMHPLLPDDYSFRSVADDSLLLERGFAEVVDQHAREVLNQVSMADVIYSFGTSNPGAITLHNYPRGLQYRVEPDNSLIDLSTTEILRDRERGVPRYNEFRKLLHRAPVKSFEEITSNKQWQEELRRVYDNDVDRVDVMVGMYAEDPPKGFGFSDTAFRIFILMASRRLNSDRFFTTDYNAKVYTQTGMDWIVNNGLASVLIRHYPQLEATLRTVDNPFAPWPKANV